MLMVFQNGYGILNIRNSEGILIEKPWSMPY